MTSEASLLASPDLSAKYLRSRRASTASNIYKSLEDIQNNLNELDNFLTITEDILRREKTRDMELYHRERQRKCSGERLIESESQSDAKIPPPLSFKNGKIFCLGNDGSTINPSNVQLTHEIVKQIINNQNNFLCYDNQCTVTDDIAPHIPETDQQFDTIDMSEEAEIFLNHEEIDDDDQLKSFNELLQELSPTISTVSSNIDDLLPVIPFEELDLNRAVTMECMAVDSPV